MRIDDANNWWMWNLNRKVAEFIHKPTEELEIEIRFLLATCRSFNEREAADLEANNLLAG